MLKIFVRDYKDTLDVEFHYWEDDDGIVWAKEIRSGEISRLCRVSDYSCLDEARVRKLIKRKFLHSL